MKMKSALSVLAAAAVALFAQGAFAQNDTTKSRADVKAEAKSNKTPAGETAGAPATTGTEKVSKEDKAKARAERKAATAKARKAHELAPAGQTAGESAVPDTEKVSKEDKAKARAERKAATAQARKEGKLAPAGEAANEKK